MEDSGFKVYKNFKTSQKVIDIYATLPTTVGDFGVVVACKNYDKDFEIGVDVLKEMEEVADTIKASKVTIVSSSYFSNQAKNYALRKNIKLVDRDNLVELARKYQDRTQTTLDNTHYGDENPEYTYDKYDMEYLMKSHRDNPIYHNSLYRQEDESKFGGISSLFSRVGNIRPSEPANLHNHKSGAGLNPLLVKILNNPLAVIILVVIVSYILSLIARFIGLDSGMSGIVEMIAAILLSYGIPLMTDRNSDFIVKGTFIFFVSLVILIILIFI